MLATLSLYAIQTASTAVLTLAGTTAAASVTGAALAAYSATISVCRRRTTPWYPEPQDEEHSAPRRRRDNRLQPNPEIEERNRHAMMQATEEAVQHLTPIEDVETHAAELIQAHDRLTRQLLETLKPLADELCQAYRREAPGRRAANLALTAVLEAERYLEETLPGNSRKRRAFHRTAAKLQTEHPKTHNALGSALSEVLALNARVAGANTKRALRLFEHSIHLPDPENPVDPAREPQELPVKQADDGFVWAMRHAYVENAHCYTQLTGRQVFSPRSGANDNELTHEPSIPARVKISRGRQGWPHAVYTPYAGLEDILLTLVIERLTDQESHC